MYDNAYNQSDSADLESEGRVMSNVINMGGSGANLQSKSINPSKVPYTAKPDTDYDGFSMVTFEKAADLIPNFISYGKKIYGVVGTAMKAGAGSGPDVNMLFAGTSEARIVFSYYSESWFQGTFMRLVNSNNTGLRLDPDIGRAYFVCDFYGNYMKANIMLALFNESTKQASIYYSDVASVTKGGDGTMLVTGISLVTSAGITGTFTKDSTLSNYRTNLEGYYT